MKKIFCSITALLMCCVVVDGFAATKTTKQSAIQSGTTVRAKVAATGIYDQECYDMYYGCMDQFCITENTDGGSCACSNDFTKYEKQLSDIKDTLERAEKISTEEVERIEAGANADIIFNGVRTYDEKGNIGESEADKKAKKRESLLAMFNTSMEDEDVFDSDYEDLSSKVGADLFNGAHRLCVDQMGDLCEKDIPFLKQVYSRQIVADCKALSNSVSKKESEAKQTLLAAESAVRSALKDSLESANKYDRGECMVEYKKCMQKEDACGKNWENCVFTIASENMQNNKTKSTAGTKVATIKTYDIAASTMEILESKRYICERVLDSCVAVRNMVWDDFLREAAPTIRLAESQAESKKRQSCLSDISKCIQKACKDDIAGKGVETMDACLARPDMARSFCKVEIDPCERMEPQIWSYVKDKLAAMRVDACTAEVKDCFTDDTRCGSDFSKCIGMDFDYIHDICPIDKLVVCKQANPKFSMSDLDSMLMGLYLNIDNSLLEDCQNLVDQRMTEVCGSTTDCNRFAADDIIGTGSIRSQKRGDLYRVTGMISFGSIKIGDASGTVRDGNTKLDPGQIGVADYIAKVRDSNRLKGADDENIIMTIEDELNNIAGTISRTIDMIESDPQIQYCVSGRDLGQITGNSGEKTEARFPNLLNSVKMQIAVSALRKAQDNYNKKITEEIAKATKDASADIAQYMCQKIADIGNVASDDGALFEQTPLTTPYSISYDVGAGVKAEALVQNGVGSKSLGGGSEDVSFDGGWRKYKVQTSGVTKERETVFNRDTRTCHVCTTTTSTSCSNTIKWNNTTSNCSVDTAEPFCEDIEM